MKVSENVQFMFIQTIDMPRTSNSVQYNDNNCSLSCQLRKYNTIE